MNIKRYFSVSKYFYSIYLFTFIFLFSVLISVLPAKRSESELLKSKISEFVKGKSRMGLIIGLIRGGKRFTFSYGHKSKEDKNPPDEHTVFEIGSITKTFTGVILADMILKKELYDTDPVSKFISKEKLKLPETDGKEITLKDLAMHISGIPAMPDNLGDFRKKENPFSDYTPEKMFESLNRCKLDFPTGTKHRYSNSGFGLLGYILAEKSGLTYEKLVNERIFKPLGMKNSSLELTDAQKKNIASGYNLTLEKKSFWNTTDILNGSGFIKSDLSDMFLYLEAVMGKDSSLKSAFELASSEQRDGYPGTWIGYGWYTELMKNGEKIVDHNGATGGFYAFVGFNKLTRVGVIILSNHKNYKELDPLGYKILTEIR